jgi:hypothetical protein
VEGQVFMSTTEETKKRDWPDLQLMLQGRLWDRKFLENFRYTKEVSFSASLSSAVFFSFVVK